MPISYYCRPLPKSDRVSVALWYFVSSSLAGMVFKFFIFIFFVKTRFLVITIVFVGNTGKPVDHRLKCPANTIGFYYKFPLSSTRRVCRFIFYKRLTKLTSTSKNTDSRRPWELQFLVGVRRRV